MHATAPIHRCMIPVAVFFILGMVLGEQFPGHWPVALILSVGLAAGLVGRVRLQRPGIVLPLTFCLVVGYIAIQPWFGVRLPDHHISNFTGQGLWDIEGRVVSAPKRTGRRIQFVLAATALRRDDAHHAVKGRVKVSSRSIPFQLKQGDVVVLKGRLRAIRNFANPGGFDYARYMAMRSIRARVYARKGSLMVVAPATTTSWQGAVDSLRRLLADRIDAALAVEAPEACHLLKALLIGERDGVSYELRQKFNAAGVSHVLAISGLHIGMVAAATFGLSRWFFSWIPILLVSGWTRKGAAVVSFFALLFYALLAGMSPSTQRAAFMATVVLMGCWMGRRHDWLNVLSLAALALLTVHPPALLSVSFQLSFMAVLAIVLGVTVMPLRPSSYQSAWWLRWVRRWVVFMRVSAMAILGTMPLTLYYFNQTSLVGLATNMLVVPLVGIWVVPAGLLGVLFLVVSPFVAEMLWWVAVQGIHIILWVVQTVAQWPWSAVRSVTPSVMEILLYYGSFGVLLGWQKLPRRWLVVMGICALWVLDITYWHHLRFGRNDMRVTAIDVGQGSANLLQLPDGYTILVDGGGFSDNTLFDVGERILAPLLWRQKIKQVDLVVLSHPNSDHLNGLLYILKEFKVTEVWSNHQPAPTLGYRKWSTFLENSPIRHTAFESLPIQQERHGATFYILSPPPDFRDQAAALWQDCNNSSLVLRVCFGEVSFLFTGDITAAAEAELVKRHGNDMLGSTVLMVPHHGSRSSSTHVFLRAVEPKEAIVSCGWHNRFGFPHQQVLQRLAHIKTGIWRTDCSGAIQIVTDGCSYHVNPFRNPGAASDCPSPTYNANR